MCTLSIHPSVRPSVRPSVHPLLDLSIYVYLSSVPIYRSSLSTCLSFYLSIHLRIHLSIHSYVYKICSFIYLFIYLLIYMYEKYAHVHTSSIQFLRLLSPAHCVCASAASANWPTRVTSPATEQLKTWGLGLFCLRALFLLRVDLRLCSALSGLVGSSGDLCKGFL